MQLHYQFNTNFCFWQVANRLLRVRTFNRPEQYMVCFFVWSYRYISQHDFQFLMNVTQSGENKCQFLYWLNILLTIGPQQSQLTKQDAFVLGWHTKSIEQCIIICNIYFHQSLIFISVHLSSVITSHVHQKHHSVNSVTRVVSCYTKFKNSKFYL